MENNFGQFGPRIFKRMDFRLWVALWTQTQNNAFDDFGNENLQRYPFEFAVGGNGDKTLKGGEDDE